MIEGKPLQLLIVVRKSRAATREREGPRRSAQEEEGEAVGSTPHMQYDMLDAYTNRYSVSFLVL